MAPDYPLRRAVPSRDEVVAEIAQVAEAEPAVLAAYLFGSAARDQAGPLSDVDVAVLLDVRAEAADVTGRLTDALARRLKTNRIDLVSLRESPIPLRYRVIRDGLVVACRDEAARQRFTAESVLLYLDFAPLRERAFARLRDGILGGE